MILGGVFLDARVGQLLLAGEGSIHFIHHRQQEVTPDGQAIRHGIHIHAAKQVLADRTLKHAVNQLAHFLVPSAGNVEYLTVVPNLGNLGLICLLLFVQGVKGIEKSLDEGAVRGIKRNVAFPRVFYSSAENVTTPALTAAVPLVRVPPNVTSMGIPTLDEPPRPDGLTMQDEYRTANTAVLAVPA